MSTQPVFKTVNEELLKLKGSGQTAVEIDPLIKFLEQVEADAPFNSEVLRLNHESEIARMKVIHDGKLEEFRSVIETAKIALTTSILTNGGATVALLALIGTFVTKSSSGTPPVPPALVFALVSFAFGVLAAAVATGSTYCSQYCYHMEFRRSAIGFHVTTVTLVLASYAAFLTGVISAYHAFV